MFDQLKMPDQSVEHLGDIHLSYVIIVVVVRYLHVWQLRVHVNGITYTQLSVIYNHHTMCVHSTIYWDIYRGW